ncbi:MAG: AmpG family muropeptide MFS transporter [Alphaproteobacteria bacterium]
MNKTGLEIYFSKKILIIFCMGISSGIPLYMVLSTLFIWLTRENIEISTVGLFALTQLPWSLKFIWAPVVDKYKIPILNRILGQRKSWLLITQICLIASLILLGYSNPNNNIYLTAFFALLTAFFSANQDIIIDAYRIEILEDDMQGVGAAVTQFGYRIGGIFAGAGSLYLKSVFDWSTVFLIISSIIFIVMLLTILVIKIQTSTIKKSSESLFAPFQEFISRNSLQRILIIILFIFFFKFGDVVAGIMANPFYVQIGFSNIEIANASKLFGVIMTLVGVFIGGYMVKKIGLLNSLLISGFFQIISNLLYVVLNYVGPEFNFLLITVAGENFSGGMGSASFVAYLSVLCKKEYSGTQYALLSSIMGLARTFLSAPSGFVVEYIGWGNFFLISTIIGIPGLIILLWMRKKFPLSQQISP